MSQRSHPYSVTQNIPAPRISFPYPSRQTMPSLSQRTQDSSVLPCKSLEQAEEDHSFLPAADAPAKSPVISWEKKSYTRLHAASAYVGFFLASLRGREGVQDCIGAQHGVLAYTSSLMTWLSLTFQEDILGKQVLRTQTKVTPSHLPYSQV